MRPRVPYPTIASSFGVLLIIGAGLTITSTSPFPGLLAVIPVAGTAIVIAAGSPILSWRWLVALGLVSYPLYLWHWPLLSLAATRDSEIGNVEKTAIVAISIFLAWGTARYIEYPIRFGAFRPRGAALSASAMLAVSLVAVAIFYSGGLPARYPPEIRPVLATMSYEFRGPVRENRCLIAQDVPFERFAPECREGHILVWGDSYAGFLSTGLAKPYAQFTRDACLPIITGKADQCAKSNAAIMHEIMQLKPRRVLLFGAWLSHSPNWKREPILNGSLEHTLHELRSKIDDVILLGPAPLWRPGLPAVVFKFWSDSGVLPDRVKVATENYHATDAVMRGIADHERAQFISIFDSLCNDEGCLTHTPTSRSELLIWDHGHMTTEGATYIVHKLGLDAPLPE